MTADTTALALAFVLAAASWGCTSTGGSNAVVQLPPRQPDPVASGAATAGAQGTDPFGNPPQDGGFATAPGVSGTGLPQPSATAGTPGFPQQTASSFPPAASTPGASAVQTSQNTGACNAAAAQSVIGELGNVEASETAKAASGAATVRITYPGQPLAQDVDGSRLNLETDDQNRIVNLRCG